MAYSFDELAEQERRRWMKSNAHLHIRTDAQRFLRPDAARLIPPSAKGWRHPDEKLRNFVAAHHGRMYARGTGANLSIAPEIARLQAEQDAIRERVKAWKDERAKKRVEERAEAEHQKRRYDAAWDRFIGAFNRHWEACRKAGFNPDQPRVPAGNRDGGRWTDSGGSGGGGRNDPRVRSDPTPDNEWIPGARYAPNDSSQVGGPVSGPPLGDPPAIPPERPPTAQERNNFLKAAAKWMAAAVRAGRSISPFVSAYEAMSWLDTDRPFMEAYLDPPKALEELQDTVLEPRSGYHIHHIVEQGPALEAGYSKEQVDARENLVRIPALKHWEITGWFGRKNKEFGWRRPRDYLRDKNWSERVRVGRIALVMHGVLKP